MARRGRPKKEDINEIREIAESVALHGTAEQFLLNCILKLRSEPATAMPSVWAEDTRFLTSGSTPFPGKWSWTRTPWFREPLDMLSPFSETQRIAIMKSTQIGATASLVENAIGFTIAADPCPALFVSGDENLIATAKKTRIDPMIDNSGLRPKIMADSLKKGIRRSGDSKGVLEFPDGFIKMCGPAVEASFQGISYKVLLLDEVDLYPYKLGKSGETVKVIEGRSDAFGDRKKIFYMSRPTVAFGISETEAKEKEESSDTKGPDQIGSRILDLYNDGDKRKYMVPCPHCGGKQELVFNKGTTDAGIEYGMSFDSEACRAGDFSSIRYLCRHCGKGFEEYHKASIVQPENGAEWVPTAKAKVPYMVSYHISSLYSLTVDWWEVVSEFLQSIGDPAKMQIFYNRFLGLPFEDRSGGVKAEVISDKRDKYPRNTIPEGVLFLTAACDVQRGEKARLEVEVKGWGKNFRNWSIDYRIFEGNTEDVYDECWQKLGAMINETWGDGFQIERMLVDSGDGTMTNVVYSACRMYGTDDLLMLPSKGFPMTAKTRDAYKIVPLAGEVFPRVDIYVDKYKNKMANWLKQDWRAGEAAPVGWPMFPSGYTSEYYRQLTTEERKFYKTGSIGFFKWEQHGRNESWDVFGYNCACADFVIEDYSKDVLKLDNSNSDAVFEFFEAERAKPTY